MDRDGISKDIADLIGSIISSLHGLDVGVIGKLYRDLFFNRFKEAYDNGMKISGDTLIDEINKKWIPEEETIRQRKMEILRELSEMWDEWNYTLDHYKP